MISRRNKTVKTRGGGEAVIPKYKTVPEQENGEERGGGQDEDQRPHRPHRGEEAGKPHKHRNVLKLQLL